MSDHSPQASPEMRSIFRNISPLDHRYYLANRELFDALGEYLSEDAVVRSCLRVEVALLEALIPRAAGGEAASRLATVVPAALRAAAAGIEPAEVYAEEEKTHHNIRALVNVLKKRLPPEVRHLVHVGATSVDILDTAHALRIRDATRRVLLPLLVGVEQELLRLVEEEAATPQIGRTHGQHAVPITFGFAMAEYVSRLGKSILEIASRAGDLRGKLAGAVGSYNATSLVAADPEAFEREVLGSLKIGASEHSTQLVEPEYLLRLLLEINVAFGVIANLADDLRHLQRSEISEVREAFSATQVGSSTMPQKRNPWNCENVKSMWKAFAPRVMTFFMDQISEHQRDLTNSASQRFVADYLAGFTAAAARMREVLRELGVDRARMAGTLGETGDAVLAEPMYILLSLAGEPDAHEIVRKLTLQCEREGLRLLEAARLEAAVWSRLEASMQRAGLPPAEEFFGNPARYQGIAERKARAIAATYRGKMSVLMEALRND